MRPLSHLSVLIIGVFALVACRKEPETFLTPELFIADLPSTSVPADSATVVEMTVQLTDENSADIRTVHFHASSGRWTTPAGTSTSALEVTVEADEEGNATARWLPGREPTTVHFSTWVGDDDQYMETSRITTVPSPPDTVLLTTPTVTCDSATHLVQLTATLLKNTGFTSTGLPLTYKAWHVVNGSEAPVGNFTTAPFTQTSRSATYQINLDLFSPTLLPLDTVLVLATCAGVESDTLTILYSND
ncbi:MAG: hypothetical protein IPJ76_13380 [Flavobacteriales bacterium]|nr:MAG: hypothetical protein IPJ76_13380 [Flavobacteriales bacterium]